MATFARRGHLLPCAFGPWPPFVLACAEQAGCLPQSITRVLSNGSYVDGWTKAARARVAWPSASVWLFRFHVILRLECVHALCWATIVECGLLRQKSVCSEATARWGYMRVPSLLRLAILNWILVSFAFILHFLLIFPSVDLLSDLCLARPCVSCPWLLDTSTYLVLPCCFLPVFPTHIFLHLLFHCAWVVLEGAPELLAFVAVAGVPV